MPQGDLTPIQAALANAITQLQTVITDIRTANASSQQLTSPALNDANTLLTTLQQAQSLVAGGSTLDQTISGFDMQIANLNTQLSTCQQQLATSKAMQPANPTTTPAAPGATAQTYVSAPAVGALMAVSAILGAAGGYAGKTYLDQRKRGAAEEAPKRIRARKAVKEMGDAE